MGPVRSGNRRSRPTGAIKTLRRPTTARGVLNGAARRSGDAEPETAKRRQTVRIHETLSLPDGRVLFNSREKNQPVTFVLGANQVIAGVDEGVTGMRVGERRNVRVPPSLDGRKLDPAFIPPDAVRQYDIELVEIVK